MQDTGASTAEKHTHEFIIVSPRAAETIITTTKTQKALVTIYLQSSTEEISWRNRKCLHRTTQEQKQRSCKKFLLQR